MLLSHYFYRILRLKKQTGIQTDRYSLSNKKKCNEATKRSRSFQQYAYICIYIQGDSLPEQQILRGDSRHEDKHY